MDFDASKQALIDVYRHQISQLESAIEDLIAPAMSRYSQYYWEESWLPMLESELPLLEPTIANAARLIGRIPTKIKDLKAEEWCTYPNASTRTVGESLLPSSSPL